MWVFLRVSALNSKLTEKLDRMYFCKECKSVFLFRSDVDDHREMSGHDSVSEQPFR
jgi:hypothetical protein